MVKYENKFGKSQSTEFEKVMANKFLPFVVEKSTPYHVYHTLLSRSKGMNSGLIASILYMVVDKGITKIREEAKRLPDMTVEKLYQELSAKFPKYRIEDNMLKIFIGMANHISTEDRSRFSKELEELGSKDLCLFMLVLSMNNRAGEYGGATFQKCLDYYDEVMQNVQNYVQFSDSGQPKEFKDKYDLKSFILYQAFINTQTQTPIKAIML